MSETPELNKVVKPFRHVTDYVKELQQHGLEKVYIHLDGWAEPGYDNHHPDYNEPCEEAGGTQAMKEMASMVLAISLASMISIVTII